MSSHETPWTLTIPSDPRLLTIARFFVEAVCHVGGLDEASTDATVLAVHEAVQNVIRHAHRDDPSAQLTLRCYLRGDSIEIHLIDQGAPFDLEAVPNLDPAELRLGGRGVFLMRKLMDELTCQPSGEGGNTLRMVKRCQSRPLTRQGA
jgi:serine/threonine-protein kinase RsbW